MKKLLVLLSLLGVMILAGCGNQAFMDTTYTFDRAIIYLPNGESVEGQIVSWSDYEGEQLQVKLDDGKTYLTSSVNIVMIAD